ncbi:MAG: 3-phosphoshikimate 1-carboxyvinyltransferase [Gammaproteobacteria bacterium]
MTSTSKVRRDDYRVQPGGCLQGQITIPGDKSISHRALLLGALASGETRISNFLEGADCLATLAVLRALGVAAEHNAPGRVRIHGVGCAGLTAPAATLDCGNSGTSMRLLSGLLAGQPFTSTLDGDESLRRRPMRRIIEPLARMGASIDSHDGCAPLTVHGRPPLHPLRYELPVASAQVKSAILLAGLYADGETWLREPGVSRDHTERMLEQFGCAVLRDGAWLGVRGGTELRGTDVPVPGDLSAAAFFLVGTAMTPGAGVTLENVGVNPTRDGVLNLLRRMGAQLEFHNRRTLGTEPVADIAVVGGDLQGIAIAPAEVPLAIDDLPILMVAAAAAHGVTKLHGARELRVKESDRLASTAAGLRALGVPVELFDDGLQVTGVEDFKGATIESYGDHRIAMAFSIAALRARAPVVVHDCRNVATSFPDFAVLANRLGLQVDTETAA